MSINESPNWTVVVTHDASAEQREIYDEVLGASCEITYVAGASDDDRVSALARADAVIATHPLAEFRDGDKALLAGARLIQQTTAGVDHVPFDRLPDGVPVAANPGTYSQPIAEHVLAMTLAAAKRLLIEDRAMRSGEFNQFTPNRMLAGGIAAILGFGGIGQESARLLRACGMPGRCWAPNGRKLAFSSTRRGRADIYIVDASGENLRRITKNAGDNKNPAWGPFPR